MKKYLLDTNICIYFLKGQFDLHRKIAEVGEEQCFISEVTIAELKYGVAKSKRKEENRVNLDDFQKKFVILPIFSALDDYAEQKARLAVKGAILDDFDLLIGSTAITNDLILVSRNVSDFERMNGINIEDWTKGN